MFNPFALSSDEAKHFQALIPFDSIVIAHPRLKAALNGIGESLAWGEVSSEPRGVVILGEGGTGKTTICKTVLKHMPAYDIDADDTSTTIVPAFACSVPASSNIRGLASSLLQGLGDPAPDEGNQKACTERLLTLLERCKTRVILLDEFHNLVNMSTPNKRTAIIACEWLIQVINASKVTFCLIGTPECENLVDYEGQMTRRFTGRYPLGDLSPGSEEATGELFGYLQTLAVKVSECLNIGAHSALKAHHFANQVWAATGGRPGPISLLYKTAMLEALRGGRRIVTAGDFATAFDTGCSIKFALVSKNPFSMSKASLAKALFKEEK